MIRAVLFDLDETLLDLNLEAYVWAFSSQRVRLISSIARSAPSKVAIPYWRSLVEMMGPRADNLTNAAFFKRSFAQESGVPSTTPPSPNALPFTTPRCSTPSPVRLNLSMESLAAVPTPCSTCASSWA